MVGFTETLLFQKVTAFISKELYNKKNPNKSEQNYYLYF